MDNGNAVFNFSISPAGANSSTLFFILFSILCHYLSRKKHTILYSVKFNINKITRCVYIFNKSSQPLPNCPEPFWCNLWIFNITSKKHIICHKHRLTIKKNISLIDIVLVGIAMFYFIPTPHYLNFIVINGLGIYLLHSICLSYIIKIVETKC